jgi:GTP pyrophosphokinase
MVNVRTIPVYREEGSAGVADWLSARYPELGREDVDRLIAALEDVAHTYTQPIDEALGYRLTADPVDSALDVIHILADLKLGIDALIAGVFCRSVSDGVLSVEHVEAHFGRPVAHLLEGVRQITQFSRAKRSSDDPVLGQASSASVNLRRMLIALIDDVRVALIKLAERTVAMRGLKEETPDLQRDVAEEVFNVYAPLAHRLGIGQIKWELEDLSFRYTHPDAYHRIAKLLDGKRKDRDQFIERVTTQITAALSAAELNFRINGRAKHIYSIWRKMQRKGIGFSQVYDIRAVRILVDSVQDCYHTLGIIHGMWRNVPNEFDDYIANPKDNGYRSLHTAVIGPDGKVLEVQIRTFAMHDEAELGVCAHWRYKGSDQDTQQVDTYEEKLSWLRQVLEWHETMGDDDDVAEAFSFQSAQDRVYVFTPDGDVVSLLHGATPIDFAYHIHTEVGHRCRGAKVNGTIVPLTYALQTGDRVEILTSREVSPRRDWLQVSAGFIKTSRARGCVRQWFRAQKRDDNLAAGRSLIERECSRLALTALDYRGIADHLGLRSVEDLFVAVGSGDITAAQVLRTAQVLTGDVQTQAVQLAKPNAASNDHAIRVDGVGNMLTHFARCCLPVPGDDIVGFITRSRGVSVHRKDCRKVMELRENDPARIIAVNWGEGNQERFTVEIGIEAYDRQGLLADVTSLMAKEKVNVTAVNTRSDVATNTASMRLTAEVTSLERLRSVLDRLVRLDNVISAKRITQ